MADARAYHRATRSKHDILNAADLRAVQVAKPSGFRAADATASHMPGRNSFRAIVGAFHVEEPRAVIMAGVGNSVSGRTREVVIANADAQTTW